LPFHQPGGKPRVIAQIFALRHAYSAIAQYLLVPPMAVVVVSGLISLAATRAFMDAGWAWLKPLLGLIVFDATLVIVGSSDKQAEFVAAAANPTVLDALLRAERNTLLLLIALSVVNVVLAEWRPHLTVNAPLSARAGYSPHAPCRISAARGTKAFLARGGFEQERLAVEPSGPAAAWSLSPQPSTAGSKLAPQTMRQIFSPLRGT
jgi:hypothetical protein